MVESGFLARKELMKVSWLALGGDGVLLGDSGYIPKGCTALNSTCSPKWERKSFSGWDFNVLESFPPLNALKLKSAGNLFFSQFCVSMRTSNCWASRPCFSETTRSSWTNPSLTSHILPTVSPRSRQGWLVLHNLPNSPPYGEERGSEGAVGGNFTGEPTKYAFSEGREGDIHRGTNQDSNDDIGRSRQGSVWRNATFVKDYQHRSPRVLPHHAGRGNLREANKSVLTVCGRKKIRSTNKSDELARKARRKERVKIWRLNAKAQRNASKIPHMPRQSLEARDTTSEVSCMDGFKKSGALRHEFWKDPEDGDLVGSLTKSGSRTEAPKEVEVWRNGRLSKRYLPLGIEFLYGRRKPTRLYGPLNFRGEVPGSGLAPVPHKYRDRCEGQNAWTIKEIVTKILELNHWEDIDFILNHWIGRYNRKNFPPLIMAITRTGALKHSERLFTWMKAQRCYRTRTDIYNLMIWLYTRHNRVDKARCLFAEMQVYGCRPDLETYNALINVHGRVRQGQESLRVFNRMLQAAVPPSTGTYNNLIIACGRSGYWQKAKEIYNKMEDDGVHMDVVTHNTVLTALKINHQYKNAIDHFEKMLKWRIRPTRVTLNIIISCLSKLERYDEAVQLFNSMKSLKWDNCYPDLVTFTTVMHAYAMCGQIENVKVVFDMMFGDGVVPNLVSYNTLMGAYATFGMDMEALETFHSIKNVGFEPDVVSYTTLMNAYGKAGRPDEAAKVFDLMKRKSRTPNVVTYNTLIDAYGSVGKVTEALGLLLQMDIDEISPTAVTICSLIAACGRSGKFETVRDVFKAAAERKVSLNVNVCNTGLSIYMNGGMIKEARNLYIAMKEEKVHPNATTIAIMINGAAKAGNTSEAQVHFDEMLSLNISLSVEACSALIHAYAEQGMPKAARAVLLKMKEAKCAPNVMTYTSLMYAYSTAGMYEDAVAVFEEMEPMGVEPDVVACSAFFVVLNRCGQTQKTLLLWLKWRERLQFGVTAYSQISRACCMLRDWKTAMKLLEEMQHIGLRPDSSIGDNLLRCLSKCGKFKLLKKVFWQLQGCRTRATKKSYNIMIDCYLRTQHWRDCLEIFGYFEGNEVQPDLKTYRMVFKCLENAELNEMYLNVYKQMASKGYFLDQYVSKKLLHTVKEIGHEESATELQSMTEDFRQNEESILRAAVIMLSSNY